VETDQGPKTSGAGLGLAIVRHMADAHEGQVFVESTPGAGSRFVVQLPVATAPEPSGEPATLETRNAPHTAEPSAEPATLGTRDAPHTPEADAEQPQADAEQPQADAEQPQADAEQPQADAEQPQADAEQPQADAEPPQADAEPPRHHRLPEAPAREAP
jgi:hypothetical protein